MPAARRANDRNYEKTFGTSDGTGRHRIDRILLFPLLLRLRRRSQERRVDRNYVVYKGVLFKTYEGKLIQTGIRSKEAGSIQSYEFEFSVEDPALARELMLQGGRTLELHYKEYFGALPWRGFTKFIVDSIVTIGPPVRRGVELPPVQ